MPGRDVQHFDSSGVQVPTAGVILEGDLTIPDNAFGVVLFAHGSGSSRFSARNRFVAVVLQRAGLATLLMDLLTPREEDVDAYSRHYRFDIELLAARLVGALDWMVQQPALKSLPVGLFGASTGAAAALVAAAQRPDVVRAVVSRGGRPDLAGAWLEHVMSPCLLAVGGNDDVVLQLNREAMEELHVPVVLEVVDQATHLFEEPGALERVADLAADFLVEQLKQPPAGDMTTASAWWKARTATRGRRPTT